MHSIIEAMSDLRRENGPWRDTIRKHRNADTVQQAQIAALEQLNTALLKNREELLHQVASLTQKVDTLTQENLQLKLKTEQQERELGYAQEAFSKTY